MIPAGRPDLAYSLRAIPAAVVAAAIPLAPGFGANMAVLALSFALFALAAMPAQQAAGATGGVISRFLDACEASAGALAIGVVGGMGTWIALLILGMLTPRSVQPAISGADLKTVAAGCAVLFAHFGGGEIVRGNWRGRKVPAAADRAGDCRNRWTPGDGVRGLDGDPPPAAEVFFAEPPAEIGPVRSAGSTLWADEAEITPDAATIYPGALAAAMGLTAGLTAFVLTGWSLPFALLFALLGALTAFAEVWRMACQRRYCAFVGRDGAARFGLREPFDEVELDARFSFADAAYGFAAEPSQGPTRLFDYRWTDENGYTVFRLFGALGTSNRAEAFAVQFARATRFGWLAERRRRIQAAGGPAAFPIRGRGVLTLTDDALTATLDGRRYRVDRAELRLEWRGGDLILHGARAEDQPDKVRKLTVPAALIADNDLLDDLIGAWVEGGG